MMSSRSQSSTSPVAALCATAASPRRRISRNSYQRCTLCIHWLPDITGTDSTTARGRGLRAAASAAMPPPKLVP